MSNKNIWFVRKRYGWGWMPSPKKWQGWLVIIAFAALTGLIAQFTIGPLEDGNFTAQEESYRALAFLFFLGIDIYLLTIVSYKYGEEPRWQWGEKNNERKDG